MNQNDSKQKDDVLQGTTRTFSEEGAPLPEDEDRAEESLLVSVNRRGAYLTHVNPFLFDTVRDMETRNQRLTLKRGTPLRLEGTEEKEQIYTTIEQHKPIDKATFVKVFSGAGFREVFNLSMPGLKMYLVVLDILGDVSSINKVVIRLTTALAKNLTAKSDKPLSKTTIDRGIGDLIEKGYLAGAEINGEKEGWYWINPQKFYNGDTVILKQTYQLQRELVGGESRGETTTVKRPNIPVETIYAAMQTQREISDF